MAVSTVLDNIVDTVSKRVFTWGSRAETTRRMIAIPWQIVPFRDRLRRGGAVGSACCWPTQVPLARSWPRVDNRRALGTLKPS